MRRLKGIPSLVSLLDHPSKDVHHSACGALKNISYGRDHDNKIAIKNCDGVPALIRLLRKTHNQDLTDTITGNAKLQQRLSGGMECLSEPSLERKSFSVSSQAHCGTFRPTTR